MGAAEGWICQKCVSLTGLEFEPSRRILGDVRQEIQSICQILTDFFGSAKFNEPTGRLQSLTAAGLKCCSEPLSHFPFPASHFPFPICRFPFLVSQLFKSFMDNRAQLPASPGSTLHVHTGTCTLASLNSLRINSLYREHPGKRYGKRETGNGKRES